MGDYVVSILEAALKYGWSLPLVGGVLIAVYKQRPSKRWLRKHFPRLVIDDSDVANYEARQIRIEQDVRAIKAHLGVTECAESKVSLTSTEKPLSKSLQGAGSFARYAAVPMRRGLTTILRGNHQMREYLKKLGRTKFQALLVSLVINVVSAVLFMTGTLDIDGQINEFMPIINMTIGTVSTWVYIVVEGGIDKANVSKETNTLPIDPADNGSHYR